MNKLHQLTTYLVMALGVVHIALAPVFFEQFTARVMWFVAQGLMVIFLGLLNLAARRARADRVTARWCVGANAVAVLFIALYLFVDRAPPSFIAATLLFGLLASSHLALREEASERRAA